MKSLSGKKIKVGEIITIVGVHGVREGQVVSFSKSMVLLRISNVPMTYRCVSCDQAQNDNGVWRIYKRVTSKVCKKCAKHLKKPKPRKSR